MTMVYEMFRVAGVKIEFFPLVDDTNGKGILAIETASDPMYKEYSTTTGSFPPTFPYPQECLDHKLNSGSRLRIKKYVNCSRWLYGKYNLPQ